MAINSPKKSLAVVHLDGVDLDLLRMQVTDLTTVLRESHDVSTAQRNSLLGIKEMLLYMLSDNGVEVKLPREKIKRLTPVDVNRVRDLCMAGKTHVGIAKQMALKTLAVARLCRGETYADVPYTPSEFAPSGVRVYAGTNKFPWTEAWEGNEFGGES